MASVTPIAAPFLLISCLCARISQIGLILVTLATNDDGYNIQ